jgi:hypothetical protein
MSGCCNDNCAIDALRVRQRGTLKIVLGINSVMFLAIAVAALYGKSTALLADSLDNLEMSNGVKMSNRVSRSSLRLTLLRDIITLQEREKGGHQVAV